MSLPPDNDSLTLHFFQKFIGSRFSFGLRPAFRTACTVTRRTECLFHCLFRPDEHVGTCSHASRNQYWLSHFAQLVRQVRMPFRKGTCCTFPVNQYLFSASIDLMLFILGNIMADIVDDV